MMCASITMAPDMDPTERPSSAPPADLRPLAGLERAMRITDEFVPFNVVVMLRVEGALDPSALRAALDVLQRRHRLLRTGVVGPAKKPFFHFDSAGSIPLEVGERKADDGWIAVAEEELGRPFDLPAGPFMRCCYLRGQSGGDLIITFQHMIVDATSVVALVHDLLALAAGRATAGDGEIADEGKLPASALFPGKYRGVGFASALAAFMARQMADEAWFRWHSRGVRKPPIFDKGNCRILPIRFPAPLTAALIQASRRTRVTLNSILSAGLIAAIQRRLYPSPRVPLRHIVFADLRPRLRSTIPERMLGCFLTMVRFSVMVERDGDFWALARDVQESTNSAERKGERFLSYVLSPGLIKVILSQRAFRWCATAFSYSGALNLPVDYESFELTEVHAFPSNWTTGPEYSALARLFRGELWWDILYLDCDMDAARAREIAKEIETILREATC